MIQGSIRDRYNIIQEIGRGGQGTVYLAIPKNPPYREVAVKVINVTPTTQNAIFQEVMAVKSISSPNCMPYLSCYYDSFFDPTTNQVAIEMEYIRGPNIMTYTLPLRYNNGNNDLLVLIGRLLTISMLYALKFTHSHGVLHNDIKPGNIVVGSDNVPVLVDFGISCFVNNAVQTICTQPYNKVIDNCCGLTSGTSLYLSPESIKNVRYPASDLWSLGSTIYEVITGNNIWNIQVSNYDPNGVMTRVLNNFANGAVPNKLNTNDQNLNTVINSFLTYDPTQRMTIDQALLLLQ